MKKMFGLFAASAVLALAPVTVDVTAADMADVIRLTPACGQATGCIEEPRGLCSTHNGNERGYICHSGCEDPEDDE